jgi:ribose-phosphate pyrophosphokinase
MANPKKNKEYLIFGLSGAKSLTESICKYLNVNPAPITISHFADGETMVRPEITVRSQSVTIVQSLTKPVHDNLTELLIATDALKRASAKNINVIIPYYAYARQDRKASEHESITSKLIASIIETAGASRVAINYGGVKRARQIAGTLNVPPAILDKRRPTPNHAEISTILGDVTNKDCIIGDDMIDTSGTIVAACNVLKGKGAKSIIICATHGILSDPATDRLTQAVKKGIIDDMYLTDTVQSVCEANIPNMHICDLGKYLSEIINVYYTKSGSISKIYDQYTPGFHK